MDILMPVCLAFTACLVYGAASGQNCTSYRQINKENIRNCLDIAPRKEPLNVIAIAQSVNSVDSGNVQSNVTTESLAVSRKMKMSMGMLQYLIVPGFLMAGILPWIMPGLQMAVGMLSMVNNMAFTSALFAMVRSYVFDKEPEEHVIYINHGYKKKHGN